MFIQVDILYIIVTILICTLTRRVNENLPNYPAIGLLDG